MTTAELLERLRKLRRYESALDHHCSCCPAVAAMEQVDDGSFVSHHELEQILKEFEDGN